MFKLMLGVMLSGLMLCSLQLRAQTNEEIYHTTLKQVDPAGLKLEYARHIDTSRKLQQKFNDMTQLMPNNVPAQAAYLSMAQFGLGIFLRILNVDAVKAHAVSCTFNESNKAGPYRYKSFAYTGANPQGLGYEMYSRTNKPFTLLKEIPPGTRFAFGAHVSYNKGWDYLVSELAKEQQMPALQQLPAMLDMQFEKKTNVKLSTLLQGMEGEVLILIISSGPPESPEWRIMVVVPDQKEAIRNSIMERVGQNLKMTAENIYEPSDLSSRTPSWFRPQFIFGDKRFTIVSNPDILDTIAKPVEGARKISESGIMFSYIDIDETTLRLLTSKMHGFPVEEVLKTFKLPKLYSVGSVGELGYSGVTYSNIELPGTADAFQLVMLAGMLKSNVGKMIPPPVTVKPVSVTPLPPKSENCVNQLKQLALGLHMYALDNGEVFPTPNNEAGLKVLRDRGCLSKDFSLSCPDNPAGYYYLGGLEITKIRRPSQAPVIFDKPGNHQGFVNIAFADGHVEIMPIDSYTGPADVLKLLNAKFNYSPEQLDDLTKRFKALEQ